MRGQHTTARPIATIFLGMDAWINLTSTHRIFDHKLRGSLMCLAYFSDMLPVGFCTTEHWHTSGRLIQELIVCTVVPLCILGVAEDCWSFLNSKVMDTYININDSKNVLLLTLPMLRLLPSEDQGCKDL